MIFKPARTVIVDGIERSVSDYEQWYVEDGRDFQTRYGVVRRQDLRPGMVRLGNEEFFIVSALFVDRYKQMRRKAQIITRKDAGFIIGYCGLTRESVVVESGAGSGGSTLLFASVCRHVHSFEVDSENIEVVRENLQRLGIANATVTQKDFYDPAGLEPLDADLVLLDLPEPWRAYDSALRCAKLGGYVVAYTPSIVSAQRFVNGLPKALLHERTLELIDRDWRIKGDAVRPVNTDIGHTAFLTFTRRIV